MSEDPPRDGRAGPSGPSPGRVRRTAVATYDRGTSVYVKGRAWVESQDDATRKGATIGWARRYRAAEGELYALLIAAYALLTFIPAIIAISTYTEKDPSSLSSHVIDRLNLTGSTARLFSDVLSNAGTKQLGATLLALANLVFFGFGFGRSLQLAHARSWGVEVRKDLLGDLGLYFVALLTMVAFLAAVLLGEEWAAGISSWVTWALIPVWFLVVLAVFTFLPWILLHREITVRQLLPGAVLVTVGLVGMRIISQILFVNWLVWYSKYYGGFGIVMALFFWLMIASTIIVVAAALSPSLSAHREARAARNAATA
jgi:membrane protein